MKYCGRTFSEQELEQIRTLIRQDPSPNRTELSRLVCRALAWYKPDGALKDMSCRVAMLRMQADELIQLPPSQRKKPRKKPDRYIRFTSRSDPQSPVEKPVHNLPPLAFQLVPPGDDSRLWNEFIHRYHYLGYKPLPGAQLRYFVFADQKLLALLGFGASAWQCAPRDLWIGWNHDCRKRNLHLIVNNARFLILPWIRVKNLSSKILARAARRLPVDWLCRYKYRPVLLESFVQKNRFSGTSYKAANWTHVGQTKDRGKLGPAGKLSVPIKDLWLFPLAKNFRRALNQ